jgi:hypothetical protein
VTLAPPITHTPLLLSRGGGQRRGRGLIVEQLTRQRLCTLRPRELLAQEVPVRSDGVDGPLDTGARALARGARTVGAVDPACLPAAEAIPLERRLAYSPLGRSRGPWCEKLRRPAVRSRRSDEFSKRGPALVDRCGSTLDQGRVERSGKGRKSNPYLWKIHSSRAYPM